MSWFKENKETKEIECDKITVPTSWNELKLGTYQKLQTYYKDNKEQYDIRNIIAILSNKDIDYINLLPMKFITTISEKIKFLSTQPEVKTTNQITINGETYFLQDMQELKMGEWVDVNTSLQNNENDYATILAILCRKSNELYDQKFINGQYENRIEMFNNISVSDALNVLSFFLTLLKQSEMLSRGSMMDIVQDLRTTAKSIETSISNGDYNHLFTFWQMRKLKKYQKLLNQISQTV